MPDEIQLPEGVVEEAARLLWELPGRGPFLEAGDVNQAAYREKARTLLHCVNPVLPAIIAQEREKWEADFRDECVVEANVPDWLLAQIREQERAKLLSEATINALSRRLVRPNTQVARAPKDLPNG